MIRRKKKGTLEFNCTRCSLCCREEGYVLFSTSDIERATKYLSLSRDSFVNKYLDYSKIFGFYVEVTKGMGCIFLDNNNDCIIQNSKPEKCKSFPYWDEYLNHDGELSSKKFDRPCPGVKEKKQ